MHMAMIASTVSSRFKHRLSAYNKRSISHAGQGHHGCTCIMSYTLAQKKNPSWLCTVKCLKQYTTWVLRLGKLRQSVLTSIGSHQPSGGIGIARLCMFLLGAQNPFFCTAWQAVTWVPLMLPDTRYNLQIAAGLYRQIRHCWQLSAIEQIAKPCLCWMCGVCMLIHLIKGILCKQNQLLTHQTLAMTYAAWQASK